LDKLSVQLINLLQPITSHVTLDTGTFT
jgi:hypothetical protein